MYTTISGSFGNSAVRTFGDARRAIDYAAQVARTTRRRCDVFSENGSRLTIFAR